MWTLLSFAAGGLLLALLALPLVGLIARAATVPNLIEVMARPVVLDALRLSLLTTGVTLGLTVLLGSPLAFFLARRSGTGVALVDGLVDLPMVLPPGVAGLALLVTFGRRGLLGGQLAAVGIELPFTTAAVILAQLFVAAPFYVRAARAGFLGVPAELEEAARVGGVTEWQILRRIVGSLALPSLVGGATMCGARALGEFGATILFAGSFQGRTQTMPLAIYAALEQDIDAAVALSLALLVIAGLLLAGLRLAAPRTLLQ